MTVTPLNIPATINPSPQVTWSKDDVDIHQSSRVHSVHSQSSGSEFSLRIRSVRPGDLGNYTCSLTLDNKGAGKAEMVSGMIAF